MSDIVIIRHSQDIPPALRLVKELGECEVYTFDPIMVDHAFYAGLENVRFFAWDDCPEYAVLEKECKEIAQQMEIQLAAITQPYFPDCDLRGWQHLNLYYLAICAQWYTQLWREVTDLLSGHTVHIMVCNTPLKYHFNSNIPALLLQERLQEAGIAYKTYLYNESEESQADQIMDLVGILNAEGQQFNLTHLPTCVYDLIHFNQELAVSNKITLRVKAKYFDMPSRAHQAIPTASLSAVWERLLPNIQAQLSSILDAISPAIDQLLSRWLHLPEHRQQQVQQISKVYQAQFASWVMLTFYFLQAKPHRLLLSDHDVDFHGPLISFATNNKIPVYLLPHAKTIAHVDFEYDDITALTHPMQGGKIFTPEKKQVKHQAIFYPETQGKIQIAKSAQKTMGLLLNSISLNGVCVAGYTPYIEGIRKIIQWCKQNDFELLVRGKPSYSIARLLSSHTGLRLNTLIEFIGGEIDAFSTKCDVCLMYDTPTSGCIEFLRNGIPILNPLAHTLSHSESTFTSADLIPRASTDEILLQLDGIIQMEDGLEKFRTEQFQRYTQCFENLPQLHSYL